MKQMILVLLTAAHCHASWFNHDEQLMREYQQQLTAERHATDDWQIIAGALAIGAVLLFTVGAALGSKIRRDARKEERHE